MRRTIFTLLLLLATNLSCLAQKVSVAELIGTWRVIKAELGDGKISAAEKKKAASVMNAFRKSVFHFKEGNRAFYDFPFPEMRIKDGYWKLDGDAVEIRDWKERRSLLMKIFVRNDNASTLFVIDETPFVLEVKKD